MLMKERIILSFLFLIPFFFQAQVKGIVVDRSGNSPLTGAKLIASDGNKTLTDYEGKFELNCEKFPVTIVVSLLQ